MSVLRDVLVVYAIGGCFGALLMATFFAQAKKDHLERAEVNQILHQSGFSKAAFILTGGLLWPFVLGMGLKGVIGK